MLGNASTGPHRSVGAGRCSRVRGARPRGTCARSPNHRSVSSALDDARAIREAIVEIGFDIYEPLNEHPEVVYSRAELEELLRHELAGAVFAAPIRTRSKLVKEAVCRALGYPLYDPPSSPLGRSVPRRVWRSRRRGATRRAHRRLHRRRFLPGVPAVRRARTEPQAPATPTEQLLLTRTARRPQRQGRTRPQSEPRPYQVPAALAVARPSRRRRAALLGSFRASAALRGTAS